MGNYEDDESAEKVSKMVAEDELFVDDLEAGVEKGNIYSSHELILLVVGTGVLHCNELAL